MAVVGLACPGREDAARRRVGRAARGRQPDRARPVGRRGPAASGSARAARNRDGNGDGPVSWRIRGSYFESCNCDAICPCRRIDGVPGGRSTHGVCLGVLSWVIEEGARGRHRPRRASGGARDPLQRRRARLALDVDPVPRHAGERRAAGRARGDLLRPARRRRANHFPWAWKASELVAVRPVEIDVDHTGAASGCGSATASASDPRPLRGGETVTCVIPGHDRTRRGAGHRRARGRGRPARVRATGGSAATGATFDSAGLSRASSPGRAEVAHRLVARDETPHSPRWPGRASPIASRRSPVLLTHRRSGTSVATRRCEAARGQPDGA